MNDEARANALPQQLADELASSPFATYREAVASLNSGSGGLRTAYLNKLAACQGLSEPTRLRIGNAIQLQCDRVVALLAPIQSFGVPLSSLTQTERDSRNG